MRWMTVCVTLGLLCGGRAFAAPDVLTAGGMTHEGQFESYSNSIVRFRTDKWKDLKEQITRVTKLTMGSPCRAAYTTADNKGEMTALFKGYEKQKFVFEKDGAEVTVSGGRMKRIDPRPAAAAEDVGPDALAPALDVEALSSQDFSPDQQESLARYKAARQAYDQFVVTSTAMVNEMNKATGARRSDLFNQLRTRKYQEQPLKTELVNAQKALSAALGSGPAAPAPRTKAPATQRTIKQQGPGPQDAVDVFMQ